MFFRSVSTKLFVECLVTSGWDSLQTVEGCLRYMSSVIFPRDRLGTFFSHNDNNISLHTIKSRQKKKSWQAHITHRSSTLTSHRSSPHAQHKQIVTVSGRILFKVFRLPSQLFATDSNKDLRPSSIQTYTNSTIYQFCHSRLDARELTNNKSVLNFCRKSSKSGIEILVLNFL